MDLALALVFPAAMIVAAGYDLVSMTIPNRIVMILAGAFFAFAAVRGWPYELLAVHALVGFAVLLCTFACFAVGWMGGGDAKLIAVSALWLGPTAALASFTVWTSLFGGVLTLAILLARACRAPTTGVAPLDRLLSRETGIPYGVAIGAAGLLSAPALLVG